MPKMKSNRAARKRFRVTGTGKIKHRTAWGSHLFKSKTKPRQIRLKRDGLVADVDKSRVEKLIGKG
jgi:large subunit ribosomal protein L35